MKANEFIKKFGLGKSREYLLNLYFHDDIDVDLSDLKRYVDAYDLVQSGLPELKKTMFSESKDLDYVKNWVLSVSEKLLTEKGIKLKQAITLVEECQ